MLPMYAYIHSAQFNWYWNSLTTHLIHEVRFCHVKIGVLCAMNAEELLGPYSMRKHLILIGMRD
jgi:hypothetical protein